MNAEQTTTVEATAAQTDAPAAQAATTEQRPAIAANDAPAFSVPDEWKDKPWASKIKTQEDVYKQIDTLDTLKGKKMVAPDFATAKPEEIEEFYKGLRPADVKAYQFGDAADPEFTGVVGESFLKNGISAHQANAIIKDYQTFEATKIAEATSADGFKEEMTKSFGEGFDKNVSAVVKEHKAHLSPEDQALMDSMPNSYLGAVYRLTAKMQKAYGAQETGTAAEGGGGSPAPADVEGQRKKLRADLAALESKPHTADDKQKLVDALANTYKGK